MKILVLGATGFIGSSIARKLVEDGHTVHGVGRDTAKSKAKWPGIEWITADISRLGSTDWERLIASSEVIVNCAGVLQDGLSDNLTATQTNAMLTLYKAAKRIGGKRIIQISARTSGAGAHLPFLDSKRKADETLAASGLDFIILRPALVLGRNSHGGTSLLRSLAAAPGILPLVYADKPIETVSVDDVAKAVMLAVSGKLPAGGDFDLAAQPRRTFSDLVQMHRSWLGLSPAKVLPLPAWISIPASFAADIAGRLGWRSPLRSTAMAVMSEGVTSIRPGPPGLELTDAALMLSANPSGVQDLWFARLYLLKPVLILTLALFWLVSGLIPLVAPNAASVNFLPFMSSSVALSLTIFTCLIDILLGLAVLIRPFARHALIGMIIVSIAYLAGGTLLQPQLWLDPLGPLVKVFPSLTLTLASLAILDER